MLSSPADLTQEVPADRGVGEQGAQEMLWGAYPWPRSRERGAAVSATATLPPSSSHPFPSTPQDDDAWCATHLSFSGSSDSSRLTKDSSDLYVFSSRH